MNIKILMMLLLCLCFSQLTYAGQVSVGTIVDQVLETDIEATIDGFPISSMNISGYTVVVAEDLRNYGFDVVWNPIEKTLVITKNNKNSIKPLAVNKSEKIVVGKKIGDVLHTDIKTYINGESVQAYNIDGSTAVLISDLSVWGDVQWNPNARTINFTSNVPASGEINVAEDDKTDDYAIKIEKTATVTLDLNFEDQKYYFEGEEVGFNNQFAMISLEFLARKLGYNITEGGTKNDPVFTIQKDNYSFRVNGKTNKVQRYFSGLLYQTDDLDIKPIEKKGVLYISDLDADFVFGLRKAWDEQTGNLHLTYSDYTVKDYGIYDIKGEQFTIISSIDDDPSAYNCFIYNKTLDLHGNMSGHSDMETGKFVHQASVMLASGHNELEMTVVYDGRILMFKTIKNISPDYELNC